MKKIYAVILLIFFTLASVGVNVSRIFCVHCHHYAVEVQVLSQETTSCHVKCCKKSHCIHKHVNHDREGLDCCQKEINHNFYKVHDFMQTEDEEIPAPDFVILCDLPDFIFECPEDRVEFVQNTYRDDRIPLPISQAGLCVFLC